MRPRLRKLALTAHIASSVGWFGAVLTFLAVAAVGVTNQDDRVVRAANLIAEPVVCRHCWVIFKLVLNVFATVVLLVYTRTVDQFAAVAADPASDLAPLRSPTFVVHAGGALVVLVVALVLAVYKPRGVTGLRI